MQLCWHVGVGQQTVHNIRPRSRIPGVDAESPLSMGRIPRDRTRVGARHAGPPCRPAACRDPRSHRSACSLFVSHIKSDFGVSHNFFQKCRQLLPRRRRRRSTGPIWSVFVRVAGPARRAPGPAALRPPAPGPAGGSSGTDLPHLRAAEAVFHDIHYRVIAHKGPCIKPTYSDIHKSVILHYELCFKSAIYRITCTMIYT